VCRNGNVNVELKLRLLHYLATDFKILNNRSSPDWYNELFEGIKSDQVASAVARLITQVPWWRIDRDIFNLFSSTRAKKQLGSLAKLVISLAELNWGYVAKDLANEITDILRKADWNAIQPFEPSALVACAGMYFKFLECTTFCLLQSKAFAMCGIKLPALFTLIQGIEERYAEVLVRSEACLSFVKDLRFAMAGCEIPLQSGDLAVRVFLYLYRLDNFELLKKFVDILCSDDQEEALDIIVSSAEIWNEVKTSKILCCFM
jgi:hypothetical protein